MQRIYATSFDTKIKSIFEFRLKERRNTFITFRTFAANCENPDYGRFNVTIWRAWYSQMRFRNF